MSRYLSARFHNMAAYTPGEQPQKMRYIKLNTNESPFPPAPGVLDALTRAEAQRLNLYPDPDARAATEKIAAYHGLAPECALLGNGSDELLAFCFQAFCDLDTPACFADVTYGFYPVFAKAYCVDSCILPLGAALEIDVGAYCGVPGTKFIANPNAPTGRALPLTDIERVLLGNPDNVVVVDEAYVDFGAKSADKLIGRYDNLVVVRTMSKSRSLAGARLGYALASTPLISDIARMKFSFNPYSVNRLSLLAAEAAMEDEAYFKRCVKEIMDTRSCVEDALLARGFTVLPSSANFLFVKPAKLGGEEYYRRLKEKGVLVRWFDAPRTRDYVRVTIGARDQMDAYLCATDEIREGL